MSLLLTKRHNIEETFNLNYKKWIPFIVNFAMFFTGGIAIYFGLKKNKSLEAN